MGYNIHTCDFINVQSLCKNYFVSDTLEWDLYIGRASESTSKECTGMFSTVAQMLQTQHWLRLAFNIWQGMF